MTALLVLEGESNRLHFKIIMRDIIACLWTRGLVVCFPVTLEISSSISVV